MSVWIIPMVELYGTVRGLGFKGLGFKGFRVWGLRV